jgi:hypothetical protein
VAFDLLAGKERPRGVHAPHAVHIVVVEDHAALSRGNPFVRLAAGGSMVLPSPEHSAAGFWSGVPAWARALAFDRGGRVLGWSPSSPDEDPWIVAARFVGTTLGVVSGHPLLAGGRAVDAALVGREIADALRVALGALGSPAAGSPPMEETVRRGVEAARTAFASYVEVPAATVQREDEMVRLGRRDSRGAPSASRP